MFPNKNTPITTWRLQYEARNALCGKNRNFQIIPNTSYQIIEITSGKVRRTDFRNEGSSSHQKKLRMKFTNYDHVYQL
jgi:hypothetical protein